MNNFIILTPTFNDWKSLSKLLFEIDKNIAGLKGNFKTLIINDASTVKPKLDLKKVKHLKKIRYKKEFALYHSLLGPYKNSKIY